VALTLHETRFKDEIIAMTFAVALPSLVVQARVMQFYVKNDKPVSCGEKDNNQIRDKPSAGFILKLMC
jgi:hypothetical protein